MKRAPGDKVRELTLLEYVPGSKDTHAVWRCRCSCGKPATVRADNLNSGATKSCGHLIEPARRRLRLS